jgi:hypothetical protein
MLKGPKVLPYEMKVAFEAVQLHTLLVSREVWRIISEAAHCSIFLLIIGVRLSADEPPDRAICQSLPPNINLTICSFPFGNFIRGPARDRTEGSRELLS